MQQERTEEHVTGAWVYGRQAWPSAGPGEEGSQGFADDAVPLGGWRFTVEKNGTRFLPGGPTILQRFPSQI